MKDGFAPRSTKDRRVVTLTGLAAGASLATVVSEEGDRASFSCQVRSDKPAKGKLILSLYETRSFPVAGLDKAKKVRLNFDSIAVLHPGKDKGSLRITALRQGILGTMTVTYEDGKTTPFEIIVLDPKGKTRPEEKPIRVRVGEEFKWKERTDDNDHCFVVEDESVVASEPFLGPFTAKKVGMTTITFIRDDEGNRDVVEVVVKEAKK